MALEIEDDVFFADLSKQIALLIMDDEEEFPVQCPPLPVQEYPYLLPQSVIPPPHSYEVAYRSARESRGTGVFIPRSTAPRRKNRSGRSHSANSNSHKHHPADKSAVAAVGQEAYNSRLYPNYYTNSSLLKRH